MSMVASHPLEMVNSQGLPRMTGLKTLPSFQRHCVTWQNGPHSSSKIRTLTFYTTLRSCAHFQNGIKHKDDDYGVTISQDLAYEMILSMSQRIVEEQLTLLT
ncbi:hypothetical protein XENOCAPTIV_000833 [Xenoophorus captivus]|uniref:Uncharacterized protein n=1 Tax=Xenoophorus captivus TaxID=1517983 RepID=A0ABV0S6U2_9TELE